MKTYRDLFEMILDIYGEQIEKQYKLHWKGAPLNLTAVHMCAVSYDLIGGIYL